MFEIVLLVILFILSAIFSAAETAITSLSRIKVGHLVEKKVPGARLLKELKDNPSQFLSLILFGNNLVNIAAAAIATSIIIRLFESRGWVNLGAAVGLATGVMTFLILVFGEITPKTVAIRNAEVIALVMAPVIWVLQIVLSPIVYLFEMVTRPFVFIFGGKATVKGALVTEDEIKYILSASEKEGVIEEEERQMITSVLEFWDTVVREVMTPRPDIVAIEASEPMDNLIKLIVESGHSRIPVYDSNLDNIIGVVYAKELLRDITGGIRDYLRPTIFVPEAKKVSDLLHEMQAARTHLAVIVDEYGITSGLVTMEDLIEEIVGEIHDELEKEIKSFEKVDENTALFDGKTSVFDVNTQMEVDLPYTDYDTIGGMIFGQLGKAPAVGDLVRYQDVMLSVERVHRRRITRIKLVKLAKRTDEEMVGG